MKSFAILSLVLPFTSAYVLPATPGNFTVSLTEIKGTGAYLKGAADASRARVTFLRGRAPGNLTSEPKSEPGPHLSYGSGLIPGPAGRLVLQNVGVGNSYPVNSFPLIFDTGSSLTWFKYYRESSTSVKTGQRMRNQYGHAPVGPYFTGPEYKDRVTLAPGLVIEDQSIGVATESRGFDNYFGVVGLGSSELTRGKLDPNDNALIPTVMENLVAQKKIDKNLFSVFLQPSEKATAEGSVTFGGIDSNLYVGDLTYVPLTTAYPSSMYWGIEIECTYGDKTIIPAGTPGIVDSGVSMILFADEYFQEYENSVTGAQYDWRTDLLVVSRNGRKHMMPLNFHIRVGDSKTPVFTMTLDLEAQLIPQAQNPAWGGNKKKRYSWIGPMRVHKENTPGLYYILGLPFMRQLYTVHDTTNKRIGFAPSKAAV